MGQWLLDNWLELFGTASALAYLYFSVKQKIWLWPLGLLSSLLYTYIYLVSGFYADMGLQVYYVVISIYGWVIWSAGKDHSRKKDLPVITLQGNSALKLLGVSYLLWLILTFILRAFTDSEVIVGDAFTTAFSITATWMLARKYIEQWLIWVVVDAVSMGLYVYKGLYITAGLFLVYTIIAVVGYQTWRKDLHGTEEA